MSEQNNSTELTGCQKASGSGASANTVVPTDQLQFVKGEPRLFSKIVDSGNKLHRAFCADCGSPIYTRRDHMPEVSVLKVGSLDAPDSMQVIMNIWTKSARPWVRLDPSVEQHPGNRPAASKT
ncbi:MAG: GFA family protein [Quisquiliibacterium sp.]